MKICFVTSQIFAWGKYGGFGSLTRIIGRELVKRGIEVTAVVPMRAGQKAVEKLEGMTIYGYHPNSFLFAQRQYKMCNADIYHSEEPTIGSYLAMKAMPDRKHVITVQDPRDRNDWKIEYSHSSLDRKLLFPILYLFESSYFSKKAVRLADAVYCQANFIRGKVKSLYKLDFEPPFLPNPVEVPVDNFNKAKEPTVCFLGRWDRRKRPEIFFEMSKQFPKVKFIALGKDHNKKRDYFLRLKYSNIPNLELAGFVDQFTSSGVREILAKSWVMINTAARECLPVAFLEAASYKCAILSGVKPDPDGFAENFGYYAEDSNYAAGLEFLLEGNKWKEMGEKGHAYVAEKHELHKVIDRHISVYRDVLMR